MQEKNKLDSSDDETAEKHVAQIMEVTSNADGRLPYEDQETSNLDPTSTEEPELPTQTNDALPKSKGDDDQTDAAVDDILHADSDAILDNKPVGATGPVDRSLSRKLKDAWLDWWQNPWKKWCTITLGIAIVVIMSLVAPVQAYVLNAFGVRSSALVTVYDGASKLPLRNAVLSVDGHSAKTDEKGQAKLTDITLGSHEVVLSKTAFATYTQQKTFGMRIVDLGDVTLKAVGTRLTYTFTDYLSGEPIEGVSLVSGEATAKSNKKGKAVLTIQPGSDTLIAASKQGYRTDSITPHGETQVASMSLVPVGRAVFVTKESGKYDVYKMYVDGKNREVLLAGTGLETQAISTLPSPDGAMVAVASTRDDKRNSDGYLLTALNLVDIESGEQTNIEHAEQITLLGWRGSTIIYLQTVAGASAANSSRQRIIAYDTATNKRFQLASANYFVGQELVGNTLYFTVSSTDPSTKETFARINTDGSAKKTLFGGTVWSMLRTDYSTYKLQTPEAWYQYTIGSAAATETKPEAVYTSRYYVDSPDSKQSVRVDARDSNGVLVVRDLVAGKEKDIATQRNMQAPLYWLNPSVVVYRVAGAAEVADYAMSIEGGTPKKLSDVSLSGIR